MLVSLDLTTELYHYFKQADNVLPSPTGRILSSVSLAMIDKRAWSIARAKHKN